MDNYRNMDMAQRAAAGLKNPRMNAKHTRAAMRRERKRISASKEGNNGRLTRKNQIRLRAIRKYNAGLGNKFNVGAHKLKCWSLAVAAAKAQGFHGSIKKGSDLYRKSRQIYSNMSLTRVS